MFMYSYYYACSVLYILFSLCCSVYYLCVNVYCTTATVNPIAVDKYISINMNIFVLNILNEDFITNAAIFKNYGL